MDKILFGSWTDDIMTDIRTKRVYEPANPHDGLRVLVDRVWPRGMTKEQVQADLWLKDVAPSAALRKWFGHDRSKWEAFKRRYFWSLMLNQRPWRGSLRKRRKAD